MILCIPQEYGLKDQEASHTSDAMFGLVPPAIWIRVTALGARFAARPGAPAKRVLESCAGKSSDTESR